MLSRIWPVDLCLIVVATDLTHIDVLHFSFNLFPVFHHVLAVRAQRITRVFIHNEERFSNHLYRGGVAMVFLGLRSDLLFCNNCHIDPSIDS